MRSHQRRLFPGRSIGALILLGMLACAVSGCGPEYGGYYGGDYPSYGYSPYWGSGWGYNPGFAIGHPWEGHFGGGGHHTEFYHAGGGHVGGARGGGGHGGGGHR
jgi:hypothetical protein